MGTFTYSEDKILAQSSTLQVYRRTVTPTERAYVFPEGEKLRHNFRGGHHLPTGQKVVRLSLGSGRQMIVGFGRWCD